MKTAPGIGYAGLEISRRSLGTSHLPGRGDKEDASNPACVEIDNGHVYTVSRTSYRTAIYSSSFPTDPGLYL